MKLKSRGLGMLDFSRTLAKCRRGFLVTFGRAAVYDDSYKGISNGTTSDGWH